jgi:hypothetical protein
MIKQGGGDVEVFLYAQITDIKGTRVGTVGSRVQRGRTQLRESLCTLGGVGLLDRPVVAQILVQRRTPRRCAVMAANKGHRCGKK